MEDGNVDYDDVESKSDVSDSSLNKSVGSSSSNHLDSSSHAGELVSRDFSFSASGSRYSFDSMEGSLGRESYSPQNNLTSFVSNQIGRHDSTSSQSSYPNGSYSFNDSSRSTHSSFKSKVSTSQISLQNQRGDLNQDSHSVASSTLRNAGSSKDLLEAAEVTINELRAEARMWELNARKLMTDLEKLQNELLDQSKHQESLETELYESRKECDGLKEEIKQVKILLEESAAKQKSTENLKYQAKEVNDLQKELEDEVKYQKESNANLALQLKKTQESNIELVSILQELEDTIEKQKMEIANLTKMDSKSMCSHGLEDNVEMRPNKDVFAKNMSKVSCDSDPEGSTVEHELGDLPEGFEPEDNRNPELELWKLKESQKNLESTIRFLEKSLQEKVQEIEAEKSLKTQTLADSEAQWRNKLAVKEEEIVNLEAKLSEAASKADDFENGGNINLTNEVKVLKQKIEELEKDCNELTDENLELLLKLKESKGDLPRCGASYNSLTKEFLENDSIFTSESEVSKMKSQICKLEEELSKKEMLIEGLSTDHLQTQCTNLEKKCSDLKLQLEAFKDKTCYLEGELCKYRAKAEEQEIEISTLRQLEHHVAEISTDFKISQSDAAVEISKTLSQLHEEIQLCLARVKRQQCNSYLPVTTECYNDDTEISNAAGLCTQKEQAVSVLNSFVQLKDFFEAKVLCDDEMKQNGEVRTRTANAEEVQNDVETCNAKKNTSSTFNLEQESLQMKCKPEITDSGNEILEKTFEIDKLKSDNFLKELEVEALRNCQRELETQISNLQNEKRQLEESIEVMLKESKMASTCMDDSQKEMMVFNNNMMTTTFMDDSRNDIMVCNSSMDSHVSTDNILALKSPELDSIKNEVEVHLSELEKENVQLSERICGLEAQLRYLTDERESSRMELQNSESCAVNLQEEVRILKRELEAQKCDKKQKLQDMQKKWLEAQEECEYLKIANLKLQTTAESLIDECSSLQQSIVELRKQKMELHEHCTFLEAELSELQKSFSDMFKEVEALEGKYTFMLEEIASKEKALSLELDALLQENKKYKENLDLEESQLNQMYLEKSVEAKNLHREVERLTEHLSATHDEKERAASAAVLEVSQLRAHRALHEASLQEVQKKLKVSESNLSTLRMESETKLLGLMDELAASKQNQEVLLADREKLLELLEDVKSNEDKHKNIVRGQELKLKVSAYERLQLEEEISSLRVQLQKTPVLQNEILNLKKFLNGVQFEKQRLEVSLQVLSSDCEELKAEKMLFSQMISDMQRAVAELEDCKRCKVSLEEKVLRLEGDLTAREALGAQDAEFKNELSRVKRLNSELRRKIRLLQVEKQECLNRAQAFELELKKMKEEKLDRQNSDNSLHLSPHYNTITSSTSDELKLSQVDNKQNCAPGDSTVMGIDSLSKIQLLESELAEALEANDMYKTQLKSFLSEVCKDHSNAHKNLADDNEAIKEHAGRAQSLEIELRALQERYFQMSLKCAEVEAERGQLVLKLRAVSNGKS
ncbi:uncharacterized protein LOC110662379 isoform X2 [Hevea brasiliensis]|nr:uncharacterized protein LOC110662379 isoform X2 [Hevea brasiliensis]